MRTMLVGGALGLSPTLQETVAWSFGATLLSFQCSFKGDRWTVVLKADFGNEARVAFLDFNTFGDALQYTPEFVDKGMITWRPDKYPPKTHARTKLVTYMARQGKGGENP